MSTLAQFVGGRPIRVTTYTSGTGTFTPLSANAWCLITMVGGGAGGARRNVTVGGGGGQPGAQSVHWARMAAAVTYAVAAGGAGCALDTDLPGAGGTTTLGSMAVRGGIAGTAGSQNPGTATEQPTGLAGPLNASTGGGSLSGDGGSTMYGKGGVGKGTGVAPDAATGYGSGGAGGFNVASGAGMGGIIIIEEFPA